jgi:hypothetical protein
VATVNVTIVTSPKLALGHEEAASASRAGKGCTTVGHDVGRGLEEGRLSALELQISRNVPHPGFVLVCSLT